MRRLLGVAIALFFAGCGKTEAPPATGATTQPSASAGAGDPVLRQLPMPQRFPDPRTLKRTDGGGE
jgi:hypothetical protein